VSTIEGLRGTQPRHREHTYWVPLASNPDAVEVAKRAARDEGFTVVTVAKVKWAPRPPDFVPAWDVTLVLKEGP
jgi:hypothetical protein